MVDTGIDAGKELVALTDAVILRDRDELDIARAAATEKLGVSATVRAIAVASNFMMMNIIMDTLGTAPRDEVADMADSLGVTVPTKA